MKILCFNLIIVRIGSITLILAFYFTTAVYCQVVKGWEVVPPSPDAAALGKYGNTPVGMYTGIPEINIPLYTIKTKKLELPIAMSYHAAGFNINELAPWTGLGWTLSAGGMISRSAVGLGDDNGGGFLYNNSNQFASEIDQNDLNWLQQVGSGIADNESDLYFYNFAGRSGKFVFDDNRQPFLVPKVPVKISFSGASNSFKIVVEDGTIYRFANRESIEAGAQTPQGLDSHRYTAAYYLTSIKSADGSDSITFSYATDGYYTEVNTNYSETIGDKCAPGQDGVMVIPVQHDYNFTYSFRTINDVIRLAEINFSHGKIEFGRTPGRVDGGNSSLSEIRIKKKNSGGLFELQKTFKLDMGYFSSYDEARLKLNGIAEHDATNTFVKSHEFFYNESTLLPARGSNAQDWWGYYNGKGGNTLVAKEMINFQGHIYQVGSAERKPSGAHMQACILKSIKYPTGGYTEFDYEPNYCDGTSLLSKDISASSGAMNNTTELLQQTVTFTANRDTYSKVTAYCSNVVDSEAYFSTVTLRKVGGAFLVNHTYDPYTHGTYGPELSKDYWVSLTPGTYELKVTSKGNTQSTYYNGGAFSKATVYWEDFAPAGTPLMAGGLRVKEIRDYEGPGSMPVIKIYKYGTSESGKGILITPETKLGSYKETKEVRYWSNPLTFCHIVCGTTRQTIYGNTPHDLTTLNGSSVIYPEVTVYEKSITAPNGKSVYKFQVEADEIYPAPQGYKDGLILLDNSWKVSDLLYSADYVGNTSNKVKEVTNTSPILQTSTIYGTKVGKRYSDTGSCGPVYAANDVYNSFYYFDYPIRSGVKKTGSTIERLYSTTDATKHRELRVDYYYDNLAVNHQQLSRKVTLDSEGNSVKTQYWYPADYGAIDNIPTLLTKNIIAKPVKEETYRNGALIDGKINRMNADGEIIEVYEHESNIPQAAAAHNGSTLIPPGYVRKVNVEYQASTKNISKVQAVDNVNIAYLWAYDNSYPIAKVVNAVPTDIAASSFESDGKGNWSYAGPIYNDVPAKTGKCYYRLGGGNITKGLSPGKYKLEYWAKGTINISGGTIAALRTSAADANGWILYEKEVTTTVLTTLTLSGASTAFIDEIRIYPAAAQMTTYTHDRLNGITSINDPANVITYYDYDHSGQLRWLQDKDGNIVKALEYHYKAK